MMSRVYAIESTPTLLGAKADHQLAFGPSEIARALRHLAGRLGAGPAERVQSEMPQAAWHKAAAGDLLRHRGRSLVHLGRGQPAELHIRGHPLNGALRRLAPAVHAIE